jgi:hypothetical protein
MQGERRTYSNASSNYALAQMFIIISAHLVAFVTNKPLAVGRSHILYEKSRMIRLSRTKKNTVLS